MIAGGLTEIKPATPEIQEIADQVKPQLEGKENKTYPVYVALKYKTQVVAGINYFIKNHLLRTFCLLHLTFPQ
uniref:Cystatin domain-containing protein n=1 Tax=Terrapene triunguis TaxID=2587831 RepID=A0A674IBB1_9SAUR